MNDPQRALALDVDGVLLDGMQFHILAWHEAFRTASIAVPDQWLYELEGIPTLEVIHEVLRRLEIGIPDDEARAIATVKRAAYAKAFRFVAMDGARDLVNWARAQRYKMAVVTGAPRASAEAAVQHLGATGDVTVLIGSEDTPNGKPSPDPYREAQTRLRVPNDYCLVIENAPAGIQSARSANLPCIAVASYLPASKLRDAHQVFQSVSHAFAWLRDNTLKSSATGPWELAA